MTMASSAPPTIPEWFRGSRVLITGGSGFMGKVLVEKLLRSCPDLDTIYLLLRPKKGKPPCSRIQDITSQPLFDKLRNENPAAFNKLVAVPGDVKELGLGLSDEDRRTLQQQVDVVFHTAASVRFDDPIRDAVLINVRGTREVVNLALDIENLKVFLHVSTTYCNRDEPEVLEKLYPAPADWRAIIRLVEEVDEDDTNLRCLTPKILSEWPNTYTYAKALGEQVINDHKDKIPMVIVRPSIVTSSIEEPIPGWVDNFNGPTGLMLGGGVGLLRSVYADPDNLGDYVPVDRAIKSLIFIAWHRALLREPGCLPIYNCCSMTEPRTLEQVITMGSTLLEELPLDNMVWFPNAAPITFNRFTHYLKVIFLHLLPAVLLDLVLRSSGRKPFLVKLQRRIHNANMALATFTTHNFYFSNACFVHLQTSHMKPDDVTGFGYNAVVTDLMPYMRACALGARVYLLKEPIDSVPQAKRHYRRMYWIHQAARTVTVLVLFWIIGTSSFLRNSPSAIQQLFLRLY